MVHDVGQGELDVQRLILALLLAMLAAPLAAATVVQGVGYCWWDDLVVPGLVVKSTGAKAADEATFNTVFVVYQFEAATDEEVYGSIQMPHGWNGTAISPHVHWSPQTASDGAPANQKVVWCFDYSWADISTTFPAATTALCGDTPAGTFEEPVQYRHYLTATTADITPGAGADAGSSVLYFRLYRDANAVADTYEGEAALVSVDFHYQSCKLGSMTVVPD